jgi:hypothetical protein
MNVGKHVWESARKEDRAAERKQISSPKFMLTAL